MSESNLERFKRTYSYKQLLNQHSLEDRGVWEIRGEDPNADWGGHHHSPYLCTVEGRLKDVIESAVDLNNFWTWGGGGNIRLIKILSLDDIDNKRRLSLEKQKLEKRIQEIDVELKK